MGSSAWRAGLATATRTCRSLSRTPPASCARPGCSRPMPRAARSVRWTKRAWCARWLTTTSSRRRRSSSCSAAGAAGSTVASRSAAGSRPSWPSTSITAGSPRRSPTASQRSPAPSSRAWPRRSCAMVCARAKRTPFSRRGASPMRRPRARRCCAIHAARCPRRASPPSRPSARRPASSRPASITPSVRSRNCCPSTLPALPIPTVGSWRPASGAWPRRSSGSPVRSRRR